MTLIPDIDDLTLEKLASRIKPVFRFIAGVNYELIPVDVDDDAYAHADLLFVKLPKNLRDTGITRQAVLEKTTHNLRELARISTYHTMSSMFNPSVAEVLAQIPNEYIDDLVAFEVTHRFPCELVHEGLDSYHKTTTILYKQTE